MTANWIYTPEEKLKIVIEGMSGTISVADLCRKYDPKPARFYYWKDQLLDSAPEIFENRGRKMDEDRIGAEKDRKIARLRATIADVVSENPEIKKKSGERLAEEGADMRSLFYDIQRTVMNTVKRAGYSVSRILSMLGISRSWYYSQISFSPIP